MLHYAAILILWWSTGQYTTTALNMSVHPFTPTTGSLLIPSTPAIFTSTKWQLIFTFNFSSVQTSLQDVHHLLETLQSQDHHPIDKSLLTKLNDQLHNLQTDFQSLQQDISGPAHFKTPRDLNPLHWVSQAFGSIARSIFGVAADDDLTRLEGKVRTLYQQQEKLYTFRQLHITTMKIFESQLHQQQQHIHNLTQFTRLLVTSLVPSKANRQKLTANVMILYGEIDSTLTQLQTIITQLQLAVNQLRQNRLPHHFLQQSELQSALLHIQGLLPPDHQFVFHPHRSIQQYYVTPLVLLLPGTLELRGVINIPIYTPDQQYTIHHILPFPSRLANTSSRRFQIQPTHSWAAVNEQRRLFIPLSQ